MPSTVADAQRFIIASVLCNDPVMYIDDRWLYDQEDNLPPIVEIDLKLKNLIVSLIGVISPLLHLDIRHFSKRAAKLTNPKRFQLKC